MAAGARTGNLHASWSQRQDLSLRWWHALLFLKGNAGSGTSDAASAGTTGGSVGAAVITGESADAASDTAAVSASSSGASSETAAAAGNSAGTAASQTAEETAAVTATDYTKKDRVIMQGVSVGGVDVSGLTEEQAEEKVNEKLNTLKQVAITLQGTDESQSVTVTAGELGLKWMNKGVLDTVGALDHGSNIIARYKDEKDLEKNGTDFDMQLGCDKNAILAVLQNQCAVFNKDAVNAGLTRSNGAFSITPGTTGQTVNEDTSADKIYAALTNGWSGQEETIDLDITTQEPKGSEEELAKVTDLLGTYTTDYSTSNVNRKTNIANGCRLINGHTLYPGETFSVLQAITPFTAENGYELAGSYLGAQVVDSFGGGICQVSTTLYNAVIRAELDVVERYNHSLIVTYVKPSMDAAIAESSGMDFKFKNNLSDPVYIEGYTGGGSITFNIYGVETRDSGRQISFESEVLETIEPEGEAVYTDSTQPVGFIKHVPAHTGYKAQLWKIVTENGKQVSKDIFNKSTYNTAPTSVTVGTAGTVSAALQAAIDAQSIEGVEAALAAPAEGTAGDGSSASSGDSQAASDELTAAAQKAAQDAYAAALSQGADENTAMAAAQAAAQQVVAAAGTGSSTGQ
jgi:vancomycin resistance protein YoaR